MTKKTKVFQLKSKTSRKDLASHNDPYYELIHKGLHLGFRRAPGTGVETWSARVRITNRYHYEALGGVTAAFDHKDAQAAAVAWEKTKRDQLASGVEVEPALAMTVRELMLEYIKKNAGKKKNPDWARVSTHKAEYLMRASPIGGVWLNQLQPRHILDLQDALRAVVTPSGQRMAAESVNRYCTVLRASLNWGLQRGWIETTPWKAVPRAKEADARNKRRSKQYFTVQQRKAFLKACEEPLQNICIGMLATGARPSELRRLLVKDVEITRQHQRVWLTTLKGSDNENYRSREFPLAGEGLAFFRKLVAGRKPEEFVFLTPTGQPWGERNLAKAIAKVRADHKLHEGWESYCWRHAVITDLVNSNRLSTPNIAKLMGTSSKHIDDNYHRIDKAAGDVFSSVMDF